MMNFGPEFGERVPCKHDADVARRARDEDELLARIARLEEECNERDVNALAGSTSQDERVVEVNDDGVVGGPWRGATGRRVRHEHGRVRLIHAQARRVARNVCHDRPRCVPPDLKKSQLREVRAQAPREASGAREPRRDLQQRKLARRVALELEEPAPPHTERVGDEGRVPFDGIAVRRSLEIAPLRADGLAGSHANSPPRPVPDQTPVPIGSTVHGVLLARQQLADERVRARAHRLGECGRVAARDRGLATLAALGLDEARVHCGACFIHRWAPDAEGRQTFVREALRARHETRLQRRRR
mmetsp:Transcript_5541/g.16806  ORF Transcript_5541/g.16806 Transcript_5541/m.16806 type:complete len:301 (-) Transcript_5541:174-1076(-)